MGPKAPKDAFFKEKNSALVLHCGTHFGIFSVFFGVRFLVYFPGALFEALWAHLEPNGVQKGRFGRSF